MRTKWYILLFSLLLMAGELQAQNFSALWKQADEANKKDLPQSELGIVRKISAKAEREKAYGQLLKSELRWMQLRNNISPDSLAPDVKRMQQKAHDCKDEVLRSVYATTLVKLYDRFPEMDEEKERESWYQQAMQPIELLARTQSLTYEPFMRKGANSDIFNDDMLSVVGYALGDFAPLSRYYVKVGMRRAACITSLEVLEQQFADKRAADDWHKSDYIRQLDSLIQCYSDLEEAGEIAIERYHALSRCKNIKAAEQVAYIHEALNKWGTWLRMNELRTEMQNLTASEYHIKLASSSVLTGDSTLIRLTNLRSVSQVTVNVYPVKVNGDTQLNPQYEKDYKQLKLLMDVNPIAHIERNYFGKAHYEFTTDSIGLKPLPTGVYLVEAQSQPTTSVSRDLIFVSDLYCMQLPLPHNQIRYCVVNAHTGQPVAGAKLKLNMGWGANKKTTTLTCNDKGEYIYQYTDKPTHVYVYTAQDRAARISNRYIREYDAPVTPSDDDITELFTDRSIYRPGQTVHIAGIVYRNSHGIDNQVVSGKKMQVTLRDANDQELNKQTVTTDEYGMCSASFVLPTQGLTGNFTLTMGDNQISVSVEEYKRPTFQLTFPKVEQRYQAGDTLEVKAHAKTYAGVPVQGASVKYTVKRTIAFWWLDYARYWNRLYFGPAKTETVVFAGKAVTAEDGSFAVQVPLILPESGNTSPMFYHYQVTADVTDQAGESQQGEMTVPLGTRASVLTVDLPKQLLSDSVNTFMFHQRNTAGQDMTATVRYQLDGGNWQSAPTLQAQTLSKLRSGKHQLMAVCGTDTITHSFVTFSLDDKRPCIDTPDWFYQSAEQFPNHGNEVVVQTGSSADDVHYCYALFSDDRILEQGSFNKSNALDNRKFTYRDNYGNGLVLVYAWVKNGQCYTHTAYIRRPIPDNKLRMKWTTFRDRLTPGQQEEWTLNIIDPKGKPAQAQVLATLYDQSLDQLSSHRWSLVPRQYVPMPSVRWTYPTPGSVNLNGYHHDPRLTFQQLDFNHFDWNLLPFTRMRVRGYGQPMLMMNSRASLMTSNVANEEMAEAKTIGSAIPLTQQDDNDNENGKKDEKTVAGKKSTTTQVRENLNETAFFYPNIMTDATGNASLRFTLPESLTSWHCMSLAHTKNMQVGMLDGVTVAQKDVMVQPNVPRFIRQGDAAQLSARIFNTTALAVSGQVRMVLINPVTSQTIMEKDQSYTVAPKGTGNATFVVDSRQIPTDCSLLICKVIAEGNGYSDGEQHYLPILPDKERVTVTLPFSQHGAGTKTIDIAKYTQYPSNQLTLEYTNHPAWLVLQTLPSVGTAQEENIISQAVSYYANSLSAAIVSQTPQLHTVFTQWQQETDANSLTSQLQKNQELRDIVLNETPWVNVAKKETEQKQRLSDFFDANGIQYRQNQALDKMKKLQRNDGSWSWWPGMEGSFYLTVEVSRMLTRLQTMTGLSDEATDMLTSAKSFMGKDIVKQVTEMKRYEHSGRRQVFPSHAALEWLYICALDNQPLSSSVSDANDYLTTLLKKEIKNQTIYDKALTAIILHRQGETARSKAYAQSLKEYTVYTEEMGRYYDTERAAYSWRDYRIPTEVVAMEAIHEILPDDQTTLEEMQRWLLQSKRTQAWDTPVNSADALYAFLGMPEKGSKPMKLEVSDARNTVLSLDGKPVSLPSATAAIGYVKTVIPHSTAQQFSATKNTDGTSWGAVYAQFMQPTTDVEAQQSGMTITRTIAPNTTRLRVGDRIQVTITIQADRDYDFVQVVDKRASCMEPIKQLSGYQGAYYCAPKDNATYYYFDSLSKGKHTITTEYYIDRAGTYHTGTCTTQCAYAPEYRALAPSLTLNVKSK